MNSAVKNKFDSYPEPIQKLMLTIRNLIFDTGFELNVGNIEESLKWGEPSYSSKVGSPIRIDWKQKTPGKIGVFFNCQTQLIATFKEVYFDEFKFQGNRALLLSINAPIPLNQLKHCFSIALQYKKLKHLPLLGV